MNPDLEEARQKCRPRAQTYDKDLIFGAFPGSEPSKQRVEGSRQRRTGESFWGRQSASYPLLKRV